MIRYSFIIPVFNRPDEVRELLESMTRQTLKGFEVIIVEDGSKTPCKDVCDKFAGVLDLHYFFKDNSGPGQSRNYGAERAQGEWLIVLDSDVVLPEGYLAAINDKLETRNEKYGYTQEPIEAKGNHISHFSSFISHLTSMMLRSREACVDYMMPLGLHHIFKFDHHYGPEPDGFKPHYPIEWCPVYYHQADRQGIGFDRSTGGSGATQQYREPYNSLYNNVNTCPENLLLWFHHVPWTRRLNSGRTVMEELDYRYQRGVSEVEDFVAIWQQARPYIDDQRWQEVDRKLHEQLENAREWQRVCTTYFHSFTKN